MAILGVSLSLQSAINNQVRNDLGIRLATFIFLSVGSFWSLLLSILWENHFDWQPFFQVIQNNPFLILPGLLNLWVIMAILRTIQTVGTVLTTSGILLGQIGSSLLLDQLGLFSLRAIPITPWRLGALGLYCLGVLLLVLSTQEQQDNGLVSGLNLFQKENFLWTGVAFCLGVAINLANILNTELAHQSGPFSAAMVFLLPGSIMMILLVGKSQWVPLFKTPLKSWLVYSIPGSFNVANICGVVILLPYVGLQVLAGTLFCTNVLTGLCLDRWGAFQLPKYPIKKARLLGAMLLIVSTLLPFLSL